ncbi:MAG: hypothetical protein KDD38_07165 [Bdellovibrionales bacterium]|nr:hypothetical protein [Bdellovibrionales bacterium]
MAQRSWIYILIGLLISSFLGGAIRVFFSPARVRGAVEKIVFEKQPKFNIEFESARLDLSGEWWPSLAVELAGIKIKAKEPCITNSTFHADRLRVPFQLSSFFNKKIRFGNIRAHHVRVFLRRTMCERSEPVSDIKTDEFAPLERFFQKRWSKELINTARFLDEINIARLEVLRDDEVLAPVTLSEFKVEFLPESGVSNVQFDVLLGEPWVGASAFGPVKTNVTIRTDEVQLEGRGSLKEGQFQITGQWAVGRGEAAFYLKSQDVPMNSVLRLAHHWGVLSSFNPNLKNQWASCDMSIAGEIRKIKNLELNLHQCRLYGDFGEINLKTTRMKNLTEGGPLIFLLQNVDVKRALSAFDFAKNWGLVSQFGEFTGEMNISGADSYELTGSLRDLEVYLSRLKVQARQVINEVQLDLSVAQDRFSGRAYDFVISNGALDGGFSFNFSHEGDGVFQFSFDKMLASRDVQKAIWGGDVSLAAVYGKGELKNSEVAQMDGSFALADLKTANWSLKTVKSKYYLTPGRRKLSVKADEFLVFKGSKWESAANSLGITLSSPSGAASLTELSAELDIVAGGGHWVDLKAVNPAQGAVLSSQGEWTDKSGLSGQLTNQTKSQTSMWLIGGSWDAPKTKAAESP